MRYCLTCRVPISKQSCGLHEQSVLTIAERTTTSQSSIRSVSNVGDAEKLEIKETSNADCENYLETDKLCSANEVLRRCLENGFVEQASGEVSIADDDQTKEVRESLVVNGDAVSTTVCSPSDSKKAAGGDAVIEFDTVCADQLKSVQNSAPVKLADSDDKLVDFVVTEGDRVSLLSVNGDSGECFSSRKRRGNSTASGADKEEAVVHSNIECLAGIERMIVGFDAHESSGSQQSDTTYTEPNAAGFPRQTSEAVVDEMISVVSECDGKLQQKQREEETELDHPRRHEFVDMGERGKTSVHEAGLDSSGDNEPVRANPVPPRTGQLLRRREVTLRPGDGFGWNSDVGARGHVVSWSLNSDEARRLSSDRVVSRVVRSSARLTIRPRDIDCLDQLDHAMPSEEHNVVPDRRSLEKRLLSEIAIGIENLQAWIHSVSLNVRANVAAGDGVSLTVEQYAGDLQNKKGELRRLSSQIEELEQAGASGVGDVRLRLVSIHSQLHDLSATLNTIVSETVRMLV